MIENLMAIAPMALAVALDLTLGEPPNRVHPVAWIGSALIAARRRLPTRGRWIPWICGAGLMAIGIGLAVGLGRLISLALGQLPRPFALIGEAIVLKSLFSIRGLIQAGRAVAEALADGNLAEARKLASWHLVGRPTEGLDAPRVAAAAIESVAENASDGVVGPLVFYALAGLPGASRLSGDQHGRLGARAPRSAGSNGWARSRRGWTTWRT